MIYLSIDVQTFKFEYNGPNGKYDDGVSLGKGII